MASPHADFEVKRCSDGPGKFKDCRVWVRGLASLNFPADARIDGFAHGLYGERAIGWCRIVACLAQTLPPLSMFTWING
jgi:hypothetical protein